MSEDVGAQAEALSMRRIGTPRGNPVELGDTHEGERGAIPKTPKSRERRRVGRDSLGHGELGKIEDEDAVAEIQATSTRTKVTARSPTMSGRSPTEMSRRDSMASSPVSSRPPTICRPATLSAKSRGGGSPEETEKEKEARSVGMMSEWLLGMPPTMPFHQGHVLIVPESAYAQGSPRMKGSLTARESWRDSWKAENKAAKNSRGGGRGNQTARSPEKRIELSHVSKEEKQERRIFEEMQDVLHSSQAAHISKMTKAHRMLDAERMSRTEVLKQKHKVLQEKLRERYGSVGMGTGLGLLGGGNHHSSANKASSSSTSSLTEGGAPPSRDVDLLPLPASHKGHDPGGESGVQLPWNRGGGGSSSMATPQTERLAGFERLTTVELANAKVSGIHGTAFLDLDQFRERAYPGMRPVLRVTSPHSMAVMKRNGVVEADIVPRGLDSFLELSGKERALVGARLRRHGILVEDVGVSAGHVEMWAQLVDAESSSSDAKDAGGGGGVGAVAASSPRGRGGVGSGGAAVSPGGRERAPRARGDKASADERVIQLRRRFKTAGMKCKFEEQSRLDLIDKLVKERRRRINASTVLVPGKAGEEPYRQLLAFGAMAKASFVAKGHGSKPPGLSYVEETSVAVLEKARAKQAKMQELERAKTERQIRKMISMRDSLQDLAERSEETEANRERLLGDLQMNLRATRAVKMSDAGRRLAAIQQDKLRELQELDDEIAGRMEEAEERHEDVLASVREKAKDMCVIAELKHERYVKRMEMTTRALEARGAELESREQSSHEVVSRIQAERARAAKEVEAARLKMLRKRGMVREIVETFKETGHFEVAVEDLEDVGEIGQIVQLSSLGRLEEVGNDMNEEASWLPQGEPIIGMVPCDSYSFFKMEHCNERSRITITLRCLDGLAELFIGNGHTPTPSLEDHTWKAAAGITGDKKIILHPFDKGYTLGMLYIGVYGAQDCTYELLAKWHDDRKPRERWGISSSVGQTRSTTSASRGGTSSTSSPPHDAPLAKATSSSSPSHVGKPSLPRDSTRVPHSVDLQVAVADASVAGGGFDAAGGGAESVGSGAHGAVRGGVQGPGLEAEDSRLPKDEAGKDGEEEDYSADEDFADDAGGVSEDGHVERDGGGVGGGGARGGMRSDVPRHMSLSKTLAQLREMDQEECTNWLRSLDVSDEGVRTAAGLRLAGAQLCEMGVEDLVKTLRVSKLQARRIAMNRV